MTTWTPLPRRAHNPVYEFTGDIGGHTVTRALNDIMAFDQVVCVDEHGNVTEAGHDAPDMVYVELDDDGQMVGSDSRDGLDVLVDTQLDGWKPMQGHCGAYGESSESFIQHPSEFIGGGLARAILEQPGHYVAVLVDGMAPDGYDEDTTVGWTVLYRGVQ
jgi:hypothetical protein